MPITAKLNTHCVPELSNSSDTVLHKVVSEWWVVDVVGSNACCGGERVQLKAASNLRGLVHVKWFSVLCHLFITGLLYLTSCACATAMKLRFVVAVAEKINSRH